MPVKGPMEEEEVGGEVDMGEAPTTVDSGAKQMLVPLATLPAAARFWLGGPSD